MGLRGLVADRSPAAGFEDQAKGFFWLAGQGGDGRQMPPLLVRMPAALLLRQPLPADLKAQGVRAVDLSHARPALRQVSCQ